MLADLNFEGTQDNSSEFNSKLLNVTEFTRAAIDAKSPAAGSVIQAAFQSVVQMEPSEFKNKNTVAKEMANKLRA